MFLILDDYNQKANAADVAALCGGDVNNLAALEPDCIIEISSYLDSRYVLTGAFPDVITYDLTKANTLGQLVYDATGKLFYNCVQNAPAGTLLTATDFFVLASYVDPVSNKTFNDPRYPMLKRILVNLVLHEKYKAINPRNVPDFIKEAREESIKWLKAVSDPKHNVNASFLPLIQYADPKRSNNISYGGRPRRSVRY